MSEDRCSDGPSLIRSAIDRVRRASNRSNVQDVQMQFRQIQQSQRESVGPGDAFVIGRLSSWRAAEASLARRIALVFQREREFASGGKVALRRCGAGGEAQLRGQVRSQVKLGNEVKRVCFWAAVQQPTYSSFRRSGGSTTFLSWQRRAFITEWREKSGRRGALSIVILETQSRLRVMKN